MAKKRRTSPTPKYTRRPTGTPTPPGHGQTARPLPVPTPQVTPGPPRRRFISPVVMPAVVPAFRGAGKFGGIMPPPIPRRPAPLVPAGAWWTGGKFGGVLPMAEAMRLAEAPIAARHSNVPPWSPGGIGLDAYWLSEKGVPRYPGPVSSPKTIPQYRRSEGGGPQWSQTRWDVKGQFPQYAQSETTLTDHLTGGWYPEPEPEYPQAAGDTGAGWGGYGGGWGASEPKPPDWYVNLLNWRF